MFYQDFMRITSVNQWCMLIHYNHLLWSCVLRNTVTECVRYRTAEGSPALLNVACWFYSFLPQFCQHIMHKTQLAAILFLHLIILWQINQQFIIYVSFWVVMYIYVFSHFYDTQDFKPTLHQFVIFNYYVIVLIIRSSLKIWRSFMYYYIEISKDRIWFNIYFNRIFVWAVIHLHIIYIDCHAHQTER